MIQLIYNFFNSNPSFFLFGLIDVIIILIPYFIGLFHLGKKRSIYGTVRGRSLFLFVCFCIILFISNIEYSVLGSIYYSRTYNSHKESELIWNVNILLTLALFAIQIITLLILGLCSIKTKKRVIWMSIVSAVCIAIFVTGGIVAVSVSNYANKATANNTPNETNNTLAEEPKIEEKRIDTLVYDIAELEPLASTYYKISLDENYSNLEIKVNTGRGQQLHYALLPTLDDFNGFRDGETLGYYSRYPETETTSAHYDYSTDELEPGTYYFAIRNRNLFNYTHFTIYITCEYQ